MKKMAIAAGAAAFLLSALAFNASADDSPQPAKSDQTATSERPPAPPRPEWVNSDGTVDMSKMPEEVPLIGSNGKVVKGEDGKPLMVKVGGGFGPKPSGLPAAPAPDLKAGESRSNEKDPDGRMVEKLEIEPTVPPAN